MKSNIDVITSNHNVIVSPANNHKGCAGPGPKFVSSMSYS